MDGPKSPLTSAVPMELESDLNREEILEKIKDEMYQSPLPKVNSFAAIGARGRQDSTMSNDRLNMTLSKQQQLLWGNDVVGKQERARQYSTASIQAPSPAEDEGGSIEASPRSGPEPSSGGKTVEKLGTFKGVFLPCLQNILGVILFLRLPWITAQAGIFQACGVVLLCALSTFVTALSLSALATNGQVQAGGPYYVVSRNLGHEVGGAIGIIFYLGTTIAASMYILGAIEALETGWDLEGKFTFQTQLFALILCFCLAFIVAVGVKIVNMSAQVFLGIVLLSIFSLVLGCILCAVGAFSGDLQAEDFITGDNMNANWTEDEDTGQVPDFLWCIGLFYPSVTGIMAGSNRSGVLKDARKSIPVGTLSAILITTCIYVVVVLLFGNTISNAILLEHKLVVTLVAWPHKTIVNVGIIMSCVGAGLQCLAGAPRLLSAIALDGTMPILSRFAAEGSKEPTKAVWLTWIIASLPCLAKNLTLITPVITMFFLVMYATVNFSCFTLTVLKTPGWRPTWRYYSWASALFGFILCLTLMILIDYIMALICFAFAIILLIYIRKQQVKKDWGDSISGIRFQLARDQILMLSDKSTFYHPKNWRPQLLVLCELDETGNPLKPELLTLAAMLKKGKGLLMSIGFVKGDIRTEYAKCEMYTEVMRMHLKENGLEGFPRVLMYRSCLQEALDSAIQSTGCGALRPNSVIMGWPGWASKHSTPEKCDEFVSIIKSIVGCNKAAIILRNGSKITSYMSRKALIAKTIDVWWIVHDGGLLLLLPHLLTLHRSWRGCRLRIFAVINEYTEDDNTMDSFQHRINKFLAEVRISADVIPFNLTSSELTIAQSETPVNQEIVPLSKIYALANRHGADILDQVNDNNIRTGISTLGMRELEHPAPMCMSETASQLDEEGMDGMDVAASFELQPANGNGGEFVTDGENPLNRLERDGTVGSIDSAGTDAASFSLDVARAFNRNMAKLSSQARLIVTNLPLMENVEPSHTVEFVEALTVNLAPTLLVRGSGHEVVTTFG
eukprot:TRINITY_DN2407_c1_g1_i1.p1 TRINITY_DN2407_c1_g1~~TRINITY_DN2407_c1_g1_i1.p1  ORF type:complete len:1017 (+),score=163.51 TRINITY_DN2407_c1_g1_i1:53-3103(+)